MLDDMIQNKADPKGKLESKAVIEVDASGLKKLLAGHDKGVVDFYGTTCGPCKIFAPRYEKAAKQNKGKAVFAKIEAWQNDVSAYDVQAVPTMIVYDKGKEVARTVGAHEPNFKKMLAKYL